MKLLPLKSSNQSPKLNSNIRILNEIPIHPDEVKKYEEKLKAKHQGIQYLGLTMEPFYFQSESTDFIARFNLTNSTNKDLIVKCIFKSGDKIKTPYYFSGNTPVHKKVMMTHSPRVQTESNWYVK